MSIRLVVSILMVALVMFSTIPAAAAGNNATIGINIVLNTDITNSILAGSGCCRTGIMGSGSLPGE